MDSEDGQRLYWATYVRPVGRITNLHMTIIDPFRRRVVDPGLERWLVRVCRERPGGSAGEFQGSGWSG